MFKRVVSVFVVALFASVMGMTMEANDQKEMKKIAKDQVPASVISAFEKAYPSAKVREYTQITKGEKVWYSIVCVAGGITKDVRYKADGTLVRARENVVAKDLPEAVRNTITETYPGAEIVKAETEVRNGIVLYELKLKVNGDHQEVTLNNKGDIIKKDDD